jgi:hypothetical protein
MKVILFPLLMSALLFGFVSEVKAQCPADSIPTPGPAWHSASRVFNINGCSDTVWYCWRSVADTTSPDGDNETQIFMTKIRSSCDTITPAVLIEEMTDTLFKWWGTGSIRPCDSHGGLNYTDRLTVFRANCWIYHVEPSSTGSYLASTSCSGGYCIKSCKVCFDQYATNQTLVFDCTYTLTGTDNGCQNMPCAGCPWVPEQCYSMTCP